MVMMFTFYDNKLEKKNFYKTYLISYPIGKLQSLKIQHGRLQNVLHLVRLPEQMIRRLILSMSSTNIYSNIKTYS